jgi:hypothetical protein
MDEREACLNDTVRELLIRENYDAHFASIEERVVVENRLFLARWAVICQHAGIDPRTVLPLTQPRWRNRARGVVYTELARGEFLSTEPARLGQQLVVFRDPSGTWVRIASEFDDGRYERV